MKINWDNIRGHTKSCSNKTLPSSCEMAPLCCPALVLPGGLFFGNVDKAVHFPKTPVSWCGLRTKPHRVCPRGIELTRKAARESDNFIWDLMCWDKAPVRIPFPKGRAKPAHQKMSQVTRSAPLWTGRRGAGSVYRRLQAKCWGQAGSSTAAGQVQTPGLHGNDN